MRRTGSAHTVLLRMAADDARAQRIRDLKAQRPGTKWKDVAAHAGVSERAVGAWAKTGALKEENAQKVAEFFKVDYEWLWFGPRETPDLLGNGGALAGESQLDRIEQRLDRIERLLSGPEKPQTVHPDTIRQVVTSLRAQGVIAAPVAAGRRNSKKGTAP